MISSARFEILAIRDGRASWHSASSEPDAICRASCLWDSGKYEQVSFHSGGRPLFFRKRKTY